MQQTLTPKQVARSIGVSESSLKRWCDRGVIQTERTAGGHRRIQVGDVLRFLRESDLKLVRPEVLGLPPGTGARPRVLERTEENLLGTLLDGQYDLSRRLVLDLYINGMQVVAICDQIITPVLHKIGEYWDCQDAEVYQERRACELVTRILFELQSILPVAPLDAPVALGATPTGDQYRIPTQMVELVLQEAGWSATSLGSVLPLETLQVAIGRHQPLLFWLSVTHLEDEAAFVAEFKEFQQKVPNETHLVIGGQALTESLLEQLQPVEYCKDLKQLKDFATELTSK